MKKKFLLPLLLVPTLCSCIFEQKPFSWNNYLNSSKGLNAQSEKFKNYRLEDYTSKISDYKNKLISAVNDGSFHNYVTYYNALYEVYVDVIDAYIISSTKYYADSSDTNMEAKSENYYDQYNDLRAFFIDLEEVIYKGPSKEIKEDYFGDISDEEIEKILDENVGLKIETEYDAYFTDYQNDGQSLYNNYRRWLISFKTYYLNAYEYYWRYIKTTREFIEKVDYDTYLEFSYTRDYDRDYTPEEVLSLVDYVKQYLVPIYNSHSRMSVPYTIDTKLYNYLNSYNFCNSHTDSAAMYEKYAETLGNEYLSCYNKAWGDGYFCFSSSDYSLSTAYQWNLHNSNESVLYFSKDYQNILSVIHEFGHYYGSNANGGAHKNDCMDMSETYSQADEYAFLNFLLNEKKDDEKYETYEFYAYSKVYDNLFYIIQEAVITEIENYVYTTDDFVGETDEENIQILKLGIQDILSSYNGAADNAYYLSPCLCSPCYYISYATSLIESMQFITMDCDDALETYVNLVENQSGSTTVERWESAGLTSPFKEESFISLSELLNEIKNKY